MARVLRPTPSRPTDAFETPRTIGPWKNLAPSRALALPLAFVGALTMLALSTASATPALLWSMLGAAIVLAAWSAAVLVGASRQRQTFDLVVVLRKQHYLQACAHLSIFLYWGWYWREVYDSAYLIASQVVFAYAFEMLLVWSRRREYTLGFGLFPIVFSTNLFLWFKADWFYLQFLMIAVGCAAKEIIRWNKDGRSVHIFNPSSLPLAVFSLALIATGMSRLTWGQEIASTFELPPHIRLWIFAVGLPGQFLFGVVTMTLSSVATVFGFGLVYYAIFHTYFFVDGFIPAAVFLGMHLLFTDPSTSPRSELGRIVFGVLYGVGVIALYAGLEHLDIPSFYDKLLPVPLMNLAVRGIEAVARSPRLRALDPARIGRALAPRRRNLAYMSIWALVFVAQSDPLDVYRPRRWLPFWEQACSEGRHRGCEVLGKIQTQYCGQGSGWSCNELGVLASEGKVTSRYSADAAFERACELRLQAGCTNAARLQAPVPVTAEASGGAQRTSPQASDYPILLQEGQGLVTDPPAELFDRACTQGFADGCRRLAGVYFRNPRVPDRSARVIAALDRACTLGLAPACADLGVMMQDGDDVSQDQVRGTAYLQRACTAGYKPACDRLMTPKRQSSSAEQTPPMR